MSKSTRNSGNPWTSEEKRALIILASKNTPTGVIALKLGRTEAAIRAQAGILGLGLKPVNQSPYNRRKI